MAAGVGPIGQELVSIIRQRIGDLRLSDKEVSRRAKMSNSTLATRLTGNTNINVDELAVRPVAETVAVWRQIGRWEERQRPCGRCGELAADD